jgi:hypothetical protein
MALLQQFKIFAYDPNRDEGAFGPVGEVWATSEDDALRVYKADNEVAALLNGKSIHLIARSYAEKHRWPDVQTGRLPHSDNPVRIADFERGRLGERLGG